MKPMRVPFLTHTDVIRRMAQHAAIIHDEVDAMTVRETKAPYPSLRVHASLARLSRGLDSQPDSDNRPTSSTLGKQTLRCGLLTIA
jgi:hypothetical protein